MLFNPGLLDRNTGTWLFSNNGLAFFLPLAPSSPPLATRLLAHKIQSPQEWEAIQALTVRASAGW